MISVIVPIYNVGAYLRQCLDSLLAQTYGELEIILVDDGSTDRSGEICDEYSARDGRISVVHRPNGGVSAARNTGLENVHGEYIGFVDPDDWASPEMFSELLAAIEETGCEIAVCGYYDVRLDKRRAQSCGAGTAEREEAVKLLLEDKTCRSFLWNKLFLSGLWDGIRFPEGRTYEDVAVMHLLFERAERLAFVDKPLYYYRWRSGSIVQGRSLSSIFDSLEALTDRYRAYEGDAELRRIAAGRIMRELCAGTDALNAAGLPAKDRAKVIKRFDAVFNACCRSNIKLLDARRARRRIYADFPRLVRLWRAAKRPEAEPPNSGWETVT